MKIFVLLAVLGASAAFPQIYTPEVAAARANFFRSFELAAAAARAAPNDNRIAQQAAASSAPAPKPVVIHGGWVGPYAATVPASLPGSTPIVSETPEVVAARKIFQNAYNAQVLLLASKPANAGKSIHRAPAPAPVQAAIRAPVQTPPAFGWRGPFASTAPASTAGSTPFVQNTAEVQAAINEFNRVYQAIAAGQNPPPPPPPPKLTGWHNGLHYGPYASTLPASVIGSTNIVMETPEVAAAKANFNRIYAQQLAAVRPAPAAPAI